MLSVVYMSVAARDFDEEGLQEMLAEARLRNEALGVTGLLVHKDGRFMQVLEGPQHSVQNRLDAILADRRHTQVKSLVREEIDRRRFDGWSMAYRGVHADGAEPDGFSRFLEARRGPADEEFEIDRSSAMWLLRWFRDHRLDEAG